MKKVLLVLLLLMASIDVFCQVDVFRDQSKCYITAQNFIKKKLSYPKEAKFDRNVVHEINGYGCATVLGKVTTKNAFGVKIEYVYKIWLEHNGKEWTDNKNWTMKKLILEDPTTSKQVVYKE